jgi:hypothetical protein
MRVALSILVSAWLLASTGAGDVLVHQVRRGFDVLRVDLPAIAQRVARGR